MCTAVPAEAHRHKMEATALQRFHENSPRGVAWRQEIVVKLAGKGILTLPCIWLWAMQLSRTTLNCLEVCHGRIAYYPNQPPLTNSEIGYVRQINTVLQSALPFLLNVQRNPVRDVGYRKTRWMSRHRNTPWTSLRAVLYRDARTLEPSRERHNLITGVIGILVRINNPQDC